MPTVFKKVQTATSRQPSYALWFRYQGPPIVAVRMASSHGPVVETLLRFGRWVGLVLADPLSGDETIELEIEVEAEGQLEVEEPVRLVASGGINPARPAIVEPSAWGVDVQLRAAEQRRRLLNLELLSIIESGMGAPQREAAWLFWYLDFQSAPSLESRRHLFYGGPYWFDDTERLFRDAVRSRMYCALDDRLGARAAGQVPVSARSPESPFQLPRRHVAYLSSFLVRTFRDWYGVPSVSPWDSGLADAVEWFAAGRLHLKRVSSPDSPVRTVGLTDGVPNSPAFMFFAEFGFVALELDVDTAAWERLVQVFVGAQLLYWRAYGRYGRKQPLGLYLAQHGIGPKPVPRGFEGVTVPFAGMGPAEASQAMTDHVGQMFDGFELCTTGEAPTRP